MDGSRFQINRKFLIKNITILFTGSAVAHLMVVLALLLIARQLGPDEYGRYAACFALNGITGIIFNLGLDIWLLREGGRTPNLLSLHFGCVFVTKVVIGVLWIILVSNSSGLLNQDVYPAKLMQVTALAVWLESLFATILTAFKAALRNQTTSLFKVSSDLLFFLLAIVLISLGFNEPLDFANLRVVFLAIILVIASISAWYILGLQANLKTIKHIVRSSFPYAWSEFLAVITMRVDVIIVGFALGKFAAGVYSPAVGVINGLFLVPSSVYMVMTPTLSRLYSTDVRQAKLSSKRTILLLLSLGIILSLGVAIGSPLLVVLLSESYRATLEILLILSVILFFKSGSFAMASILVSRGLQAERTIVQLIAAVTNIIANLLVVYHFGIKGVAIVYVFTEVIIFVGYTWLVCRTKLLTPELQVSPDAKTSGN